MNSDIYNFTIKDSDQEIFQCALNHNESFEEVLKASDALCNNYSNKLETIGLIYRGTLINKDDTPSSIKATSNDQVIQITKIQNITYAVKIIDTMDIHKTIFLPLNSGSKLNDIAETYEKMNNIRKGIIEFKGYEFSLSLNDVKEVENGIKLLKVVIKKEYSNFQKLQSIELPIIRKELILMNQFVNSKIKSISSTPFDKSTIIKGENLSANNENEDENMISVESDDESTLTGAPVKQITPITTNGIPNNVIEDYQLGATRPKDNPFKCNHVNEKGIQCSYSNIHHTHLRLHRIQKHNDKRKYYFYCLYCQDGNKTGFSHFSQWKSHMKKEHALFPGLLEYEEAHKYASYKIYA